MQRRIAFVIAFVGAAVCTLPMMISGCPALPGGGGGVGGNTFNLAPTPVITTDVISGVSPLTVQFDSSRSTDDGLVVSREWDFGDGSTSAQLSVQHTFASNGDYVVTLTLTDDNGLSASETVTIAVTDAPVAVIAYSPKGVQAAPASVSFDGADSFDDGTVESYSWDFGDGARSAETAATHVYAASGMYQVQLTVTDDKGVTGKSAVMIEVGIETPTIEVRVPPPGVKNIVVPSDSPIWVQAVFNIELGANRFTHAGLDRDQDLCDSQAMLFGAATGATIHTLTGHSDLINDVAFSPDGSITATASDDGTVKLYSTSVGALTRTLTGAGRINTIAFSPDGVDIAWGQSDGDIVLAEAATGAVIRTFVGHTDEVNDLAFSPDGTELLSASDDHHAILWNVSDGTVLRDFEQTLEVNAVAISPFDPTMVASAGEDAEIKIWNTISGTALTTILAHEEAVNALAFSSDGQALVSGSDDNTAVASSPFSGEVVTTYAGHDGNVLSVALSPDASRLVTGSTDGTMRVWFTGNAAVERVIEPCESPISAVAVSPDGARYAAAVAAYNDIPLTTDPSEGDDYNITFPRELSLKNIPSLGFQDAPNGEYFLWVEIDSTLASEPVRAYAEAKINVIDDLATTLGGSVPVIPLVEGEADVAIPGAGSRHIFDLGALNAGDEIYFSLLSLPGFEQSHETETEYSIMLLDADEEIVAWYQDLEMPSDGINPAPEFYNFVMFNPETRTILGHDSDHYYVVVDGDVNVFVRVEPSPTGIAPAPRQQTVYVRFDGQSTPVSVGGQPAAMIGPLDAGEFDPDDPNSLIWKTSNTGAVKDAIMAKLNDIYGDFDIVFVSSDDGAPAPPYETVYVGGVSLLELLGAFDAVDPRNQTHGGRAIAYANTIARKQLHPSHIPPGGVIDTPEEMGAVIGNVVAHEVGHLLGLRNTSVSGDVMRGLDVFKVEKPRENKSLKTASPSDTEQVDALPVIGTQNARKLLEETVGFAP